MVQIKAFSYNPNAKYQPSGVYKTKDSDIIKQTIEVKQLSDSGSSFKAKFPDVFDKNMLPYVENDALVRAWNYTPMRFWQNQLNFAVWCATTGCGVSYEDHLSGDIPGFANPCLCSTYTIKSAVSYLSSRHHYQRINPGTPLITQWMQKPMKKSALNST